jgi:hypothetical protein
VVLLFLRGESSALFGSVVEGQASASLGARVHQEDRIASAAVFR